MINREFEKSDLEEIKSFDKEELYPFLLDPFTFGKVVIEDEKGIILVGLRRVVNEFKIIPNNSRSSLEISRAIKEAFGVGLQDAKNRCPTEIYVFVTRGGKHYENLLKRHFSFSNIPGVALKLEV